MSIALIRGYDNRISLFDLWGQAFGDTPDFISDMYSTGYLKPSDVYALTKDGRLISALFLPEYRIRIEGKDFPIRLLSCVCTDPSQQGKGYMSRLISRVLELVRNDCSGVCVIPVSESLSSFYEKFGFSSAFYVSEQLFESLVDGSELSLSAKDPKDSYQEYRKKYLTDGCVYKTEDRFLQAVAEYEHPSQSSDFLTFADGFAFIQRGVNEIVVREFGGITAEALAPTLLKKYGVPVRIQNLPREDNRQPIAMLKPFSEELEFYAKTKDLYLNCMYN